MNITGSGSVLTAATATLQALKTDGQSRIAGRFTTNQPLTLRCQVSADGTLWSDFPLAFVQSGADIVGQGIKFTASLAVSVDVRGFVYARFLLDNASGATATFTAEQFLGKRDDD